MGTGLRNLPVPEQPARVDDLVPRPHPGHDPPQRVRRAGRLLPDPRWTGRRRRRSSTAAPAPRPCCPGPRRWKGTSSRPNKTYYEIPIADPGPVVQRRRLPLLPRQPRVLRRRSSGRFIPDTDLSPIWNPEFFGNMIMVNGNTWPFQVVEQRRYRLRFLNGCQSRFLILDFGHIPGVEVWADRQRGWLPGRPGEPDRGQRQPPADGAGRARRPHRRLHERAGGQLRARQPRSGRAVRWRRSPAWTSSPADPESRPARSCSSGSFPPSHRTRRHRRSSSSCRPSPRCPAESLTRPLALIEKMASAREKRASLRRRSRSKARSRPCSATSSTGCRSSGSGRTPVTENPTVGDTEVWEFHNFTADAHPMHVHEITFEVVNRAGAGPEPGRGDGGPADPARTATSRPPEAWEIGLQGHRHRLPRPGDPDQGEVRLARASSSGTATSSSTRTTR